MTYVEALKVLNCTAIDQCGICLENKENGGKCLGQINFTEALEVAISALEKQIPKKPKRKPCMILCPTCESTSTTLINHAPTEESYIKLAHCIDCGQAIDWSDTK